MRRAYNSVLKLPQISKCPQCAEPHCAAPGLPGLRLLQGSPGSDRQRRLIIQRAGAGLHALVSSSMRIAVDVMGGDHVAAS